MAEKYRNLPLNPLRAFSIASQHSTFTAAAAHMGISQVAISRQINVLEDYLGVTLFERSARSVKLTDVGRAFSREISGPFHDLENATQKIRHNEREQIINLRIYPTLVHYWLSPRLTLFYDAFPNHMVRLDTAVQPLDFRGTHLDLAFQLGHGEWGDSRNRKLFDETIDVVCSPQYAERFDGFRDPHDLSKAMLLHAKYRRREWNVWIEHNGLEMPDGPHMTFESSLLAYGAARDGLGLAIGQIDILQDELKSGRLIRPFMRPAQTGSSFYIVWPTVTSVSTPTRHFVDWLLELNNQPAEFFKRRT